MEYLKKSELKRGSLYMKPDGGVYWYVGIREPSKALIFYKVYHLIAYDTPIAGVIVPFSNEQYQLIGRAITGIMLSPVIDPRLIVLARSPKFAMAIPDVYRPSCCSENLIPTWRIKAMSAINAAEERMRGRL